MLSSFFQLNPRGSQGRNHTWVSRGLNHSIVSDSHHLSDPLPVSSRAGSLSDIEWIFPQAWMARGEQVPRRGSPRRTLGDLQPLATLGHHHYVLYRRTLPRCLCVRVVRIRPLPNQPYRGAEPYLRRRKWLLGMKRACSAPEPEAPGNVIRSGRWSPIRWAVGRQHTLGTSAVEPTIRLPVSTPRGDPCEQMSARKKCVLDTWRPRPNYDPTFPLHKRHPIDRREKRGAARRAMPVITWSALTAPWQADHWIGRTHKMYGFVCAGERSRR